MAPMSLTAPARLDIEAAAVKGQRLGRAVGEVQHDGIDYDTVGAAFGVSRKERDIVRDHYECLLIGAAMPERLKGPKRLTDAGPGLDGGDLVQASTQRLRAGRRQRVDAPDRCPIRRRACFREGLDREVDAAGLTLRLS